MVAREKKRLRQKKAGIYLFVYLLIYYFIEFFLSLVNAGEGGDVELMVQKVRGLGWYGNWWNGKDF